MTHLISLPVSIHPALISRGSPDIHRSVSLSVWFELKPVPYITIIIIIQEEEDMARATLACGTNPKVKLPPKRRRERKWVSDDTNELAMFFENNILVPPPSHPQRYNSLGSTFDPLPVIRHHVVDRSPAIHLHEQRQAEETWLCVLTTEPRHDSSEDGQ